MNSVKGLLFSMRPWMFVVLTGSLSLLGCDAGDHSQMSHGGTGGAGGQGGAGSGQGSGGAGVTSTSVTSGPGAQTSTSAGSGQSSASSGASSSSSGGNGHPMAPNGYYVDGNTIYDQNGKKHLFHGVARPSFEWSSTGEKIALSDFQLMKSWGATTTRLALNQDFWLQGAAKYDINYQARIDQAIQWAHQAGLDVILDLHWSDRGDLNNQGPGQQRMADKNSVDFWKQVATKYKGDGRVLFELYNEPHDVAWNVWLSGGQSGDGFQVYGMQQLYDAVRGTGAENLVMVGGLDFAFDLSNIPANRVQGHNIVYVTHPYDQGGKQPGDWEGKWGYLTQTDPVIVTEFGTFNCSTSYYSQLIQFADSHNASWTAWAWYPGGCNFPAVINDWSGSPNGPGQVIKTALLGY